MTTRTSAPRRRVVAVLTAAGALALTGLAGAGAAGAGPVADRSSDSGISYVRTAHLSPDTPKVDVYLTAFRGGSTKLWVANVGYGDATAYRRMPAGQYAVSMRPAGAAKTSPAALSWTVTLRAGDSYTAAAIGEQAKLHGIVFADSKVTPQAGKGYVRVVQAADQAKDVSVHAGSTTVSADIGFGSVSSYATVPAGQVSLNTKSLSNSTLQGTTSLRLASRSAVTVLLLDKQGGGIQARPLVDIAGPSRAPTGAVPAGAGGTARQIINLPGSDTGSTATVIGLGGVLAMLAVGAGTLAATRRRRSAAA